MHIYDDVYVFSDVLYVYVLDEVDFYWHYQQLYHVILKPYQYHQLFFLLDLYNAS